MVSYVKTVMSDNNNKLRSWSFTNGDHQNLENSFFDVEFQVPFEPLREHMMLSFGRNNHIKSIWFSAKVDLVARSITNIQIWREDGNSGLTN